MFPWQTKSTLFIFRKVSIFQMIHIAPSNHSVTGLQRQLPHAIPKATSPRTSVLPPNRKTPTEAPPDRFQTCEAEQVCSGNSPTQSPKPPLPALLFCPQTAKRPQKPLQIGSRLARLNRFAAATPPRNPQSLLSPHFCFAPKQQNAHGSPSSRVPDLRC